MSDQLIFENSAWIWPVIAASLIIFLLFLWKESKRAPGARVYLHAVIALLAIFALAMIALKPQLPGRSLDRLGIVLTPGYDEEQLDSLMATKAKDDDIGASRFKDAKQIPYTPDRHYTQLRDSLSSVLILGHGIAPYDLWQFDDLPGSYLGGVPIRGIDKIKYEPRQTLGDELFVRGRIRPSGPGLRVVLTSPGGEAMDSLIIEKETAASSLFELKAPLKTLGRQLFQLIVKDSLNTMITNDPLPVIVEEAVPLRILILNSYPTFETKYLKNFLAEEGHELVTRSQLTTNRYKFEYFNTERLPVNTLTRESLRSIDLLILDRDNFRALGGLTNSSFRTSIEEDGLGVLVQADERLLRNASSELGIQANYDGQTEIGLAGMGTTRWSKYPYALENDLTVITVHQSEDDILSAYQQLGLGKIGLTVLDQTFNELLEGREEAYQDFWSTLVEALAKRAEPQVSWQSSAFIAFQDEPFEITVYTGAEDFQIKERSGMTIPLRQHSEFPQQWTGTVYPRSTGWHALEVVQDSSSTHQYYVADTDQWKALRQQQWVQANRNSFARTAVKEQQNTVWRTIDPLWFYLLFLGSMGFLWVAPKW
ncbi:hypothetical protein [Croceiramulus getboli]|nr:hypothetical protein P8624_13185 [Flavobacteriaceae bacterium YJPT1-3]